MIPKDMEEDAKYETEMIGPVSTRYYWKRVGEMKYGV